MIQLDILRHVSLNAYQPIKAVCSPQIASLGGVEDTGVHCCAYSGILEELLSVFENQVLWFECSVSTMCVGLCELQL